MCVHSEAETRLSFICNSTPRSMTSLRLPTSDVIEKCLLVVIHPGYELFTPHANTVQLRKETFILQMWWIELKYGFYLQNPAYCPRIYLWIFDKYSSTSFWWLSVYQQNFTAKSIKYYNPPPSLPPPPVLWFFCFVLFLTILFLPIGWFQFYLYCCPCTPSRGETYF